MAQKSRGGFRSSKHSHTGYRSAKNGRFVTKKHAERSPDKAVRESIPNPGRGDT